MRQATASELFTDPTDFARLLSQGIRALPALGDALAVDMPIEQLEQIEVALKAVLKPLFLGPPLTGPEARAIASFQRESGLLLKYKSYAVKACNPLGYSLFLQQPQRGFSFQRHLEHKVEIFHILNTSPGAFAFICDYTEWQRIYRTDRFAAWLAGAEEPLHERHRTPLQPGDVLIVDRLNVVHTIVGCVLEEFATASTDMVDRLFDQNRGQHIAFEDRRSEVQARLARLPAPAESCHLTSRDGLARRQPIPWTPIPGAHRLELGALPGCAGAHFLVERGRSTDLTLEKQFAQSFFIHSGSGRLIIADDRERNALTPPSLAMEPGDAFLVPPGVAWGITADGEAPLRVAQHRILPALALGAC
jgi:hypothetical protein